MNKKDTSLINSLIKNCDRTDDGNIKPEARERVLVSLKKYLEHTGRANISEIAEMLGLSRQTTKNLIDEILTDWIPKIQDQSLLQSKWMESVLKDLDQNPETFNKDKIAVVNLKSSLLSKLNALQKLALKQDSYGIKLYMIKQVTPKELPSPKPP